MSVGPGSFSNPSLMRQVSLGEEAYKQQFRDECKDKLTQCMTYKLIPDSGKVVVFDSELPVSCALSALLMNDLNCGCVYNSNQRCYVGMLSASDFLDILIYLYEETENKAEIGEKLRTQRISQWQDIKKNIGTSRPSLIHVTPESSLWDAVVMLSRHQIHRLAVVQVAMPSTVLCVLSHHRILHFLLQNYQNGDLKCFDLTLRQLGLGAKSEIVTTGYSTRLISALELLRQKAISTLPIIENNVPVDTYSRSDVRLVASTNLSTRAGFLDLPLRDVLGPQVCIFLCMYVLMHVCV
jgi:5'-AMP-activated protein kinase regulatory gamma subunit